MKDWLKSLLIPDQRRAARKKMPPVVAYFWDGGRPVAHNVRDISSTGFYLTTNERWLLGTLVTITFQRTKAEANRPDCSIIIMAKVIHHGDDGVGFTFIPVDTATPGQRPRPGFHAADRKTLDRFLQRLASDRD